MKRAWLFATLLAAFPAWSQLPPADDKALPPLAEVRSTPVPPTRTETHRLTALAGEAVELLGTAPRQRLEFSVRGDEIVTSAWLDLTLTASPALLPEVSHLKVYLNDQLMDIVPVAAGGEGRRLTRRLPLDTRLIRDFNRLRFEMVGHYTEICENPTHSSLWMHLAEESRLTLTYQTLPLAASLSRLPAPFFYLQDARPLNVPFTLVMQPSLDTLRAGAILASYFGVQAEWRGQHFPVHFETPPRRHGVVLATNDRRPSFLADHPRVTGPTVTLIDHPDTPYAKLLVLLGRDGTDLVEAARGIALGTPLLRGQRARITQVSPLAPRQPYDAPNWVRTDRPARFSELIDYPEQLRSEGIEPDPLTLDLDVPPDLFIRWKDEIELRLNYHYTPPPTRADSRLDIDINGQYLDSFVLEPASGSQQQNLRLSLLDAPSAENSRLTIPALKLGAQNQLRFAFRYASLTGQTAQDSCQTLTAPNHRVRIDESSTLDLSGYHHYLAMPALHTYAEAGFPFTRMADLSETLVVLPESPSAAQLTTLLDAMGRMGAQSGYPGVAVHLSRGWQEAEDTARDVLALAPLPASIAARQPVAGLDGSDLAVLQRLDLATDGKGRNDPSIGERDTRNRVTVQAEGPLAAVLGLESPWHEGRSIVALLANGADGQHLLTATLNDAKRRREVAGSVTIIREGGIHSQQAGERYHVGQLPWTAWLWYHLSRYPWLIAALAALATLLASITLWRLLRRLGKRRLELDE